MPFIKKVDGKSVRDYKAERDWEVRNGDKRGKERALRGKARREMGLKVGDPRQVDHKKELSKGGSNSKSNLRVTSAKVNADKEVIRKKSVAKKVKT